jgi:spermidine synthase
MTVEAVEPCSLLDWDVVATARVVGGAGEFVLGRFANDWVIRVDDRILMSNRMHNSEEVMAEYAFERFPDAGTVLVGGLGLGYTLRAVLDLASEDAQITVAELVPELVGWNRDYLGHLNDHPMDDPRCNVIVGDVFETLKRSPGAFDLILLDVDNGPQSLAEAKNQRLYGDIGVRTCRAALRPGGILVVWSCGPSARYVRKLKSHGFEVDVRRVASRVGGRVHHVIFMAR